MQFRCERGHVWWTRAASIVAGSWCPECFHKKRPQLIRERLAEHPVTCVKCGAPFYRPSARVTLCENCDPSGAALRTMSGRPAASRREYLRNRARHDAYGHAYAAQHRHEKGYKETRRRLAVAFRDRRRAETDAAKMRPCSRCGGSFPPWEMDHHHLDPAHKRGTVARLKYGDPKTWKAEVGKSILLCANCHALTTFGEHSVAGPRWYRLRGTFLAAYKAGPCRDCGGEFPPAAMHFDHLPGTKKAFGLGAWVAGTRTASQFLVERAKCDLICANCHRQRTKMRLKGVALPTPVRPDWMPNPTPPAPPDPPGTGASNRAKEHCPRGHEYTPENTYLHKGPSGSTTRHCRLCAFERGRARRPDAPYGKGARNRLKTHCPQGHAYTPENTYEHVGKNGQRHRQCRTCMAEREKRRVRRPARKRK